MSDISALPANRKGNARFATPERLLDFPGPSSHTRATMFSRWKFLPCLFLAASLPLIRVQSAPDESVWEPEIRAFERADRSNPPPQNAILFLGSSSIRKWDTLAEDFAGWKVINRGFGGSQIADSTALADRIVFPYHPSIIVFYAGDNDLAAGKSVDQVVLDYKGFVAKIHARLPDTKIVYIAIKPSTLRWKLRDEIVSVNSQIAALSGDNLAFCDVYSHMLTPEGKPRRELLLLDGLHPSRECYTLWASLIKPYLGPPAK
jgi:lysophospholipase L1-like esterase